MDRNKQKMYERQEGVLVDSGEGALQAPVKYNTMAIHERFILKMNEWHKAPL